MKDKEYHRNYYHLNKEKRIESIKKYKEKNKDKVNEITKRWRQTNPAKRMLRAAKSNAVDAGLEFNLELEDIVIPTHCPYLGVELVTNQEVQRHHNNISIDRVDSTKGYVKGNIQIISYLANKMKQDATVEQLLTFAQGIQKLHG